MIERVMNKNASMVLSISIISFLCLFFFGCSSTDTDIKQFGRFVDSPVQGLYYETETQAGVTNEKGTFTYMPDERISFYIGDVELGSSKAKPLMTPVHLVAGAEDETHPTVTNLAVLIQSLDEDDLPDNGITIPSVVRDLFLHRSIDFNLSYSKFQNQTDIIKIFNAINEKKLFHKGNRTIISKEVAQEHMRKYMPGRANTSAENKPTVRAKMYDPPIRFR